MKKKQQVEVVASISEMDQFGGRLAETLIPGSIVALHGDLGAGKTTLAKAVIEKLTKTPQREIFSPTFTYLNIYGTTPLLYHFDLYRIPDSTTFIQMGFADHLEEGGICLIEWAERIDKLLPSRALHIRLNHLEGGKREIHVYKS